MTGLSRLKSTENFTELVSLALWRTVLFCAAWNFAAFLLNACDAIPFRYVYNYVEPVLAEPALNIPHNPLIYGDLNKEPFLLVVYTPLYLYLSYFVSIFTGHNFMCGRLVSLAALLLTLFILYRILRIAGAGKKTAALFSLLYFMFPVVYRHGITMKSDMTGIALNLVGVYFMLNAEKGKRRAYALGVLFFTLAFFTKQSLVTGMAGYFLYLAFSKRLRAALDFLLIQSLAVALPSLFLNALTQGNFFAHQMMLTTQPFYTRLLTGFWINFFPQVSGVLLLSVAYLVWRLKNKKNSFLACYFIATAFYTLSAGKNGSDDNLFLEIAAAACLLSGVLFENLTQKGVNLILRGTVWAALIFQLFYAWQTGYARYFHFPNTGRKALEAKFDEPAKLLKNVKGDVLTDYMGFMIANNRRIVYEPFEFTQAANGGRWDEELVLRKLRKHEFEVVVIGIDASKVLRSSHFSARFILTLRENYRFMGVKQGNYFYAPAV